ncbi:PREDICTED: class II histocompatibility antigen, M alpha chain-like [Thamnophis sirtalis]|uniref:Class II histocompatibility antigen, M alpha chain-like n=1 Tax=Thamnophis sirtalis TaxID=35019 RepID=A0A6I9YTX8_9SAUR|nr:PREDICTED: class II histocompatibility antigen, M alpha chain-like [Thamnophis sirtalis]
MPPGNRSFRLPRRTAGRRLKRVPKKRPAGVAPLRRPPPPSESRFGRIPQVEIFTLRPLVLGQPNVLVCSARNIFPPVARIRWAFQGQELTQGVSSTPVFPVQELDFQIFSYVEMTPREGDIYSCTVKGLGGKFDTMAYWAPKDPVASKLLENVLCGLAVAVGGVFIIVGVVLLALSFRFRSSD